MDLSVLPNNNHPDKFLQLEVKSLMKNSALLQASLVRFPGGNFPVAQHWQNLIYSQREKKTLNTQRRRGSSAEGTIAADSPPRSLSSILINNPLYGDISLEEALEERKKSPSWTIEEYDKHSLHTNLSGHLKEKHKSPFSFHKSQLRNLLKNLPSTFIPSVKTKPDLYGVSKENPNDLRFWLGDMYTPGFDTLLKKEEEEKHSKYCRIGLALLLGTCVLVSIVTISSFLT